MIRVDDTSAAIETALDQVGTRLKRLRTRRRLTLTRVANATGISKSTLSRLENGQRRPTLELLLALSRAYRVPLDDLVGAPEVGDPRIRLKAGQVKGRTVIPLTGQLDAMQAWKIVIPTSKVTPEPRAHDGYEWIYVLSGHMRLVLGDKDWFSAPAKSLSLTLTCRTGSAARVTSQHLVPMATIRRFQLSARHELSLVDAAHT
jgi:transcriptional regulator with XRE-family HTH domain